LKYLIVYYPFNDNSKSYEPFYENGNIFEFIDYECAAEAIVKIKHNIKKMYQTHLSQQNPDITVLEHLQYILKTICIKEL
jgi:hypothetical protein